MGMIVAAAIAAHVPPLVVAPEMREWLSPGRDTGLIEGLGRMREALDEVRPDCFLIFDTHWITTTEHVLDAAAHHRGTFTSSELPHLMHDVPYDYPGARDLGQRAAEIGAKRGVRIIPADNPWLPKHYATLNLLHYLQKDESVLASGTCQTAECHNFLEYGQVLREAIEQSDYRVALVASGGLSHRFWPYDSIFEHAGFDPRNIRSDAARKFDKRILDWFAHGDHAAVINAYSEYRACSPEGWFGHYLTMAGTLGGTDATARGRLLSDYESQLGTGQAHVWFELEGVAA